MEIWAVSDLAAFQRLNLDNSKLREKTRLDKSYGVLLGQFEFNPLGEPVVTYPLKRVLNEKVQKVFLRIRDNWGHPDWTCLYRVRVHGSE